MLAGTELTLPGAQLGKVLYMTDVSKCGESSPAKTGFDGPQAPFLSSLYNAFGTKVFSLTVSGDPHLVLGATPPSTPKVSTPFSWGGQANSGGGGRVVKITAVNGEKVKMPGGEEAAIDTGNGSFLSYGPGSALSAATKFPFSITFEGGGTLTFQSAPKVNGKATRAVGYTHNVLSLGFLSEYTTTLDDGNQQAHFA